ncbi:hypothetical protein ABB29_06995 [Pseudoxanthomonas dokdonensis]|uniref:DUF11 domain-containing protein n=2 Tax=Pseudoxanthomonas dokdonensis TaxID=344882 RepID=A0A0R0CJF1_9GAMM|nr:hypothetical protein ABB29_06995 [Pseudoxanthomonas dokdonensis]
MGAGALGVLLLVSAVSAQAQLRVEATFRNSTEPGWSISGTDDGASNNDSGILTGGYGAIPNNVNDANGDGWLRLTTNSNTHIGRALLTSGSFASSQGVLVEMEYVAWGGNGADGIAMFLYDAASDMAGAGNGASLGYCGGVGGYLGVGLDEYGLYSGTPTNPDCADGPGSSPDQVVVRAPQSASNVYIGGAAVAGGIDNPGATSRPAPKRVRLLLVPNGSGGYRVTVGVGAAGAVPPDLLNELNFPYSAPANLRLGLSGSTGGLNNIHEVRNLIATAPADILVQKTVDATTVLRGQPVTYTVTVTNNDINQVDPGDQSPTIDSANTPAITDTLPAELLAGATWTCTASAGSTCPAASGTGSIAVAGGYTLAPGGVLTFTVQSTVATTASCDAEIDNSASAAFDPSAGFTDLDETNNAATATFQVVCPTLIISKVTSNGVGTFSFTGDNGVAAHDITTVTAGTPVDGATQTLAAAGVATTLVEAEPQDFFQLTDASCTGLGTDGTATFDAASRSLVLDAAATTTAGPIRCTFSNIRNVTDLQISKTGPATAVTGDTATFVLTVNNAGPTAVSNAILTDTPDPGLDCTQPGTATCEASAGASCPAATVAVSDLTGAGITLPSMPVGGQVVVTMQCTVTADGVP